MHNFTQKLLQLLPLCTYNDILSNGSWSYLPPHRRENPWAMCPDTLQFALGNEQLADQHARYSCMNQSYGTARFEVPNCNILPLRESLHALQFHGAMIAYVGDSLSIQLYLSLRCASEWFHVPQHQDISYQSDSFLRGDIPCDPRCLTDPSFRNQTGEYLRHPCLACRKNDPTSFGNYASSPLEWHHKIPNDTTALIIGSGAWYNLYKGILNSTTTYSETLNAIGPIFYDMKRTRNIDVFWQGLPSHNVNMSTHDASVPGYEWVYYSEKDAVAKAILEPYGVIFIDNNKLTKPRKVHDPSIAADIIHWCNPGLDAVPAFLNRVIFHLLAMKTILKLATHTIS